MRTDKYSVEMSPIFTSIINFNRYKTIVEVGVHMGHTTRYLCEAALKNDGFVYGFDIWGTNKYQRKQVTSKKEVDEYLKSFKLNNYELIHIDTANKKFKEIIEKKCPIIDFAFIDGDHTYSGLKNDFDIVYPLLNKFGAIAFHDTLKIDGCREFMIDLRTIYNDGTFDIIDLPWGNKARRVGISLLVKRVYPIIDMKIDQVVGSPSSPEKIYEKEQNWYQNETHINIITT